ncbi:Ig-like domain-containing protein [Jiulongibacter sp. NS-SX5]|uniref:Ig-like domain-containing protein n=1 Tax=Jiulongibacter sp. NS-SX5 TaxID=3463854 RepID=UPI004057D6F6
MKRILVVLSLLITGCAQFVPPTGGDKDEDPPELISSYPENKTLNFKDQLITLEFNELVESTTLRQEMIITPKPEGAYDLKSKPYGVQLKFDEPLEDSTTYTINFRNGIKDLNEKNPARNLKVVFSTGDYIDSLEISGQITNLLSGKKTDEATVALYDLNKEDTLPLLKQKPKYFFTTDTTGNFVFENLKASQYRLLAFTDKNSNLYFDSKTEFFGFLSDTISLDSNIVNLDLQVYPNNIDPPKIKRSLSRQENFSISFDKPIKSVILEYLNPADSLTYKLMGDELLFFNNPFTEDTVQTKIIVLDSIGNSLEEEKKIYFNNNLRNSKNEKIEAFRINVENINSRDKLVSPKEYILEFEEPISNIDQSKITLTADTTYTIPFDLTWLDDSQTKLKIAFTHNVEREIELNIPSNVITSYKSDTNSTYTLINKVYQQEELGTLSGRYTKFEGNKIAELLHAKTLEILQNQSFTDNYRFDNVIPGEYKIRIIEDLNNNNQWDTGNFEENKQPERVVVSKGTIKLKANFEINDIQLN